MNERPMNERPMNATHTSEPVSLSPAGDVPVAEMLARAFHEDPMFTFLLPDPARRTSPLRWFMERGLTMGHRYGLVDTIPSPPPRSASASAAGPAGVAVWLRPGHTTPGPIQLLRAGVATLPLRFGRRGFRKFLAIMNHTDAPTSAPSLDLTGTCSS